MELRFWDQSICEKGLGIEERVGIDGFLCFVYAVIMESGQQAILFNLRLELVLWRVGLKSGSLARRTQNCEIV